MHRARGKALLVAGFVAAYAAFVAWYHAPYAGGSDSSGYLNSAQLILQGRISTPLRLPDSLPPDLLRKDAFIPLGFRPDVTGREMVPTYPVGLPLHLAAIGWLTGLETASRILGVAMALAFPALLYLTSRQFGVRPAWSFGVAALGALSPLTVLFALQPMSDLLAAIWVVAAILCARSAERGSGWALGAGAALAIAVLVRPTNLLCAIPALLALPARPRAWLAFGLGGLPGALFQAWYNHALYGAYATTGYGGEVGVLFSWQHVAPSLWHYALWVPVVASPLAAAAFALPWAGIPRRDKLVLGAWAGILFGFYTAYAYTNDAWWYMRFLLPAIPALGIAAALVLQSAPLPSWFLASRLLPPGTPAGEVARGRVLQMPLALLAFIFATGWMCHWSRRFQISGTELYERGYPLTGRWVAQSLPADGVLLGQQVSGALLYYTSRPFLIPDWFSAEECARLETWLAQNRRSLYAALYPHEEAAVWRQFPGRWEKLAQFRHTAIWHRVERGAYQVPTAP